MLGYVFPPVTSPWVYDFNWSSFSYLIKILGNTNYINNGISLIFYSGGTVSIVFIHIITAIQANTHYLNSVPHYSEF